MPDVIENLASGVDDRIGRLVDQFAAAYVDRYKLSPRGQPGQIGLQLHPHVVFGGRGRVVRAEHEQWAVAETPRCPRLGGGLCPGADLLHKRRPRLGGVAQAPDGVPFRGRYAIRGRGGRRTIGHESVEPNLVE